MNHLTDAMAEMRSEMGRLSTIIHGIATRQLDQENSEVAKRPSPQSVQDLLIESSAKPQPRSDRSSLRPGNMRGQPSGVPASNRMLRDAPAQALLPDSSSDNSVASSTSKKSHSSEHTVTSIESNGSQASSVIRSPPPKKTRQGRIPTTPQDNETMHHVSEADISDDHDVFNGDTAIFDAVLDDAIRMNLVTSRFDANVSPPEDNLLIRMDHNATMQVNQHQPSAPTQPTTVETSPTSPDSQPAPLDPRYTTNTGSAGAAMR